LSLSLCTSSSFPPFRRRLAYKRHFHLQCRSQLDPNPSLNKPAQNRPSLRTRRHPDESGLISVQLTGWFVFSMILQLAALPVFFWVRSFQNAISLRAQDTLESGEAAEIVLDYQNCGFPYLARRRFRMCHFEMSRRSVLNRKHKVASPPWLSERSGVHGIIES